MRRVIGALVLDAGAYEDIEADRSASLQSALVVLAVCVAGGVGAIGLGVIGLAGFITAALLVLGAWVVWAGLIATVGTIALPEPQTKSSFAELLRVLGYASAPGLFLALAAMRAVAPVVMALVAVWMTAAAVMAVREALDYKGFGRAAAVCLLSWLLSFGVIGTIAMMLTRPVS